MAIKDDMILSIHDNRDIKKYDTIEELQKVQLSKVIYAAIECAYNKSYKPIRILDLATGNNRFNSRIVKNLNNERLDYELILSDASVEHLTEGYRFVTKDLNEKELGKIKCVLMDIRDFRSDLDMVPFYKEQKMIPLQEVLHDTRYSFLKSGYEDGKRIVDFSDQSFDMVIGCIPYGSVRDGYEDAISESARLLKLGGFHIVDEMEVLEMNEDAERTYNAIKRAREPFIKNIQSTLDEKLNHVTTCSAVYKYQTTEKIPSQTLQNEDTVRCSVFVHRK